MRKGFLLPTLAAIAMFALTVSLGNWQMDRAAYKAGLQAELDAAERAEPLRLGAHPAGAYAAGNRLIAVGRFLPGRTVLIDNRTHNGISGVHVVTALRVEDPGTAQPGALVAVLRGWIARDPTDRSRVPAVVTPAGVVEVEGWIEPELAKALELGTTTGAGPVWQNFDHDRFERLLGEAVLPFVLRQNALRGTPDDGLVRAWPVPGNGVAKHHGYAFQWYALAALVAGLWGWFLVKGSRRGGSNGSEVGVAR